MKGPFELPFLAATRDVGMLAATTTVVLHQRAVMFVVSTSYLCQGSANELLTFQCS